MKSVKNYCIVSNHYKYIMKWACSTVKYQTAADWWNTSLVTRSGESTAEYSFVPFISNISAQSWWPA